MDSLANYASDGDNSNNSDDVKVRNREDTQDGRRLDRRRRLGRLELQCISLDMAPLCVSNERYSATIERPYKCRTFMKMHILQKLRLILFAISVDCDFNCSNSSLNIHSSPR